MKKPRQQKSFAHFTWVLGAALALAFLAGAFLVSTTLAVNTSGNPIPPGKQQTLDYVTNKIATARALHPGPKIIKNAPRTPLPHSTPQAGFIQTHQGPFPSSYFLVQSRWQGPIGKNWVLAYAGAQPNPDGTIKQGGMLLYTVTWDSLGVATPQLIGEFPAPGATATPLHITGVSDTVLHLQLGSGDQLTFDLQTHLYAS